MSKPIVCSFIFLSIALAQDADIHGLRTKLRRLGEQFQFGQEQLRLPAKQRSGLASSDDIVRESRILTRVAEPEPDLAAVKKTLLSEMSRHVDTDPPSPADLAESSAVRLTPEIRALAQQLQGSPARLHAFVRNNISYSLYFGGMQNALAVLWSRRGNNVDTSTLLIALLRASGIPARYGNGTVEASVTDVGAWVGARRPAAVAAMVRVPLAATVTGETVRFSHVWVEAWLDSQWVKLDPSFKALEFQPGLDVPALPFDSNSYLSTLRTDLPSDIFVRDVLQYIRRTYPGSGLSDAPYTGLLAPASDSVLPPAPSYRIVQAAASRSDMDTLAHRVVISLVNPSSGSVYLRQDLSLTQICLQSITFGSTGTGTGPFTPQMRLDDQVIATSNSTFTQNPANRLSLYVQVQYFYPGVTAVDRTLLHTFYVDDVFALGIHSQQVSNQYVGYRIDRLLNTPAGLTADPQRTMREILHIAAIRYLQRAEIEADRMADPVQIRYLPLRPGFTGTTSLTAEQRLPDRPFLVTSRHFIVDVQSGRPGQFISLNKGDLALADYGGLLEGLGALYSALEHEIWEEVVLTPAASTVKILQVAADQRIPILTITPENAATMVPTLPIPQSLRDHILSGTRAGNNVVVPARTVTWLQWSGTGYRFRNVTTGTGGWFVGRYNGGDTGSNSQIPVPPPAGPAGDPAVTNGTACSDPVTVSSGNMFQQQTDLAISSRGLAVVFQRTYNSLAAATDGPFGFGWTHNYRMSLKDNVTSVAFVNGSGGGFTFALQGNAYVSPAGLNLRLTKDAQGFLLRGKYGTQLRFDANGALQSIADRNQNTVKLTYDSGSRLTTITDDLNRAVTLSYDAAGHITAIQDFTGRRIGYTYDGAGNLASATNMAGNVTTYTYYTDAVFNHLLKTKTPPGGSATTYEYFSNRKAARVTDAAGRDTRFLYLPFRNETVFIDARGFSGSYFYNALGNVTRVVKPDGNQVETVYTADAKIASYTDENGYTRRYTYDASGNMASYTDPTGNTWRYAYEANFNRVSSSTDARGAVTSFEYDARGNLTRIVLPLGVEARFTYDNFGKLLTVTGGEGSAVSLTYDTGGNLVKIGDALGNTSQFQFDALRRLTRAIDATGGARSVEYDALDRVVREVDALDRVTAAVYDSKGNLSQVTNHGGGVARYSYDALDNLAQVTDEQANTTRYGYSAPDCGCSSGSNLISFNDPSGRTSAHTYDSNNRLTQGVDASGAATKFAYSARGNLTRKTDANGNAIRYEYDAGGRLVRKIFPDGSEARFTYDANGQLTGASNANTSVTFTYNELSRIASASDSRFGKTIQYEYNRDRRRTALTDSEGGVTAYTYDANSRLTSVTSPSGAAAKLSYDALNHRSGMAYANGASAVYRYDAASRLTSLAHGGTLPRFDYTYDQSGNPTAIADNAGTHSYRYDELNRLMAATHPASGAESYAYDGAGNRTASARDAAYVYDAAGRLMAAEGGSYTYDKNGNVTRRTGSGGTTTYNYDFENQLTRIDFPDGSRASYKYDALGRRIEKNVRGVVTAYLYDGVNILLEMDSAGQMIARYTHGTGVDEPLMMERGGKTYFYHADRMGSIAAVSDASGNAVCSYVYDAFGATQACASATTPYGFAGREYDAESGLYAMRARYYDPRTGRFLSADPLDVTGLLVASQGARAARALIPAAAAALAGGGGLRAPQRLNRYSYAFNNPLVFRDPSGLKGCDTTPPWQRPDWHYDSSSGDYVGPADIPFLTSLRDDNGNPLFDHRGNIMRGYYTISLGTSNDENREQAVVSVDDPDHAITTFPYSAYGRYRPSFDELPAEMQTIGNLPVDDLNLSRVAGATWGSVKGIPGGAVDAYHYLNNSAPEWARF